MKILRYLFTKYHYCIIYIFKQLDNFVECIIWNYLQFADKTTHRQITRVSLMLDVITVRMTSNINDTRVICCIQTEIYEWSAPPVSTADSFDRS